MPTPSIKVDNASYILTLDPERRIVQDGSLLIENGQLTRIGKAADLADVGADRVIDASGMVITPAFVQGHLHISYAHAVRGIFPDDVVGQQRLIDVFRLQSEMGEQDEYYTSLLAIIELLRSGTVTFVDPGSTKFVDACLQVYQDSGCRIVTGVSLVDEQDPRKLPYFPTDEALARTERFIKTYDRRLDGRLRAWAMPFGNESCSAEFLAGCKRLADQYGTGLTIHHTARGPLRQHLQEQHGLSPTAYLESIGALGPNVLLAHCVGIDDSEVEVIARTGCGVCFCTTNILKEAQGAADRKLPELLERGVNLSIGSDSANSSNYLDTVRTMNLTAIAFRDARRDLSLVPAEQAVEIATLLGARALGLGDEIGSLEVGKRADLVLFDANRAEWRSLINPVNNLVYNADAGSVHTVIADGRIVVENHQVTFADERQVGQKVQEVGEALVARAGVAYPRSRWPLV
jgi:5-methylthioadenosine/S-adenosylhomocysteine deaminase